MTADPGLDPRLERRLRANLTTALDGVDGPHPTWAGSPASQRVARRPRAPWRPLLVLAAVVGAGALGALVLSGVTKPAPVGATCLTLADYAAASARPTPVDGTAPDVSFPPVGPEATATTGMLQPGDWAVVADADGPGIEIRIRDVRSCDRLPDVRSAYRGGSFILATVDIRSLRPKAMTSFLGPNEWIGMGLAGLDLGPTNRIGVPGGGIPGVDTASRGERPDGFEHSSLMIFDVPATDAMVTADFPTREGQALHGLHAPIERDPNQQPTVRWLLRSGRETGGYSSTLFLPQTDAMPSNGDLSPGTVATVTSPAGNTALMLTDVDQVDRYPTLEPSAGHVFLEARFVMSPASVDATIENRWRIVDSAGRELALVTPEQTGEAGDGVLRQLAPATFVDAPISDWLVIEAPPTGLVRAELLRDGATEPTVSYVLRQP